MVTSAMIEKLFAVIGGEREGAVLPLARCFQTVDQAGELNIDPADSGIVERDDLVAIALEAPG